MIKNIAVLPGDGIGPEVIDQAIKVLNAVAQRFGHTFNYEEALVGAVAIDEVGDPFPTATYDLCVASDAVLFGAIGHPKYDNDPTAKVRPEQGLLAMRKALDLYANLRPVKSYDNLLDASPLREHIIKGVDFVVVRELISGIYFGKPKGRSEDGKTAYDMCMYDEATILRITKLAFEIARTRRKKVTLVDKANVLATSRLWRQTVGEYAKTQPDIELDTLFVDAAAMVMITNPRRFDVVLTTNMFGDIITDEASVITGSMGTLPSASIGSKVSLYEPIHGSYPQAAGQNRANPIATILSAAMMLTTSFDMQAEADAVQKAVDFSIDNGIVTEDISNGKSSTSEVGDFIAKAILDMA